MKEPLTLDAIFEGQHLLAESDPEFVEAVVFLAVRIDVVSAFPRPSPGAPSFRTGFAYGLFLCIKLEIGRDDVLRLAREAGWSGDF